MDERGSSSDVAGNFDDDRARIHTDCHVEKRLLEKGNSSTVHVEIREHDHTKEGRKKRKGKKRRTLQAR